MTLHSLPATRPATYRDVLEAPPHMVAEIVRGALHLHPRAGHEPVRPVIAVPGPVFVLEHERQVAVAAPELVVDVAVAAHVERHEALRLDQ
jgi:hypothetical protein